MITEKLEYLMKRQDINNLKELSKLSKIPYTTLRGFYEKGTEGIRISTISKLVKYFGCTYDYLIDDTISKDHILHQYGITENMFNQFNSSAELESKLEKLKYNSLDISKLSSDEKAIINYIISLMNNNGEKWVIAKDVFNTKNEEKKDKKEQ